MYPLHCIVPLWGHFPSLVTLRDLRDCRFRHPLLSITSISSPFLAIAFSSISFSVSPAPSFLYCIAFLFSFCSFGSSFSARVFVMFPSTAQAPVGVSSQTMKNKCTRVLRANTRLFIDDTQPTPKQTSIESFAIAYSKVNVGVFSEAVRATKTGVRASRMKIPEFTRSDEREPVRTVSGRVCDGRY